MGTSQWSAWSQCLAVVGPAALEGVQMMGEDALEQKGPSRQLPLLVLYSGTHSYRRLQQTLQRSYPNDQTVALIVAEGNSVTATIGSWPGQIENGQPLLALFVPVALEPNCQYPLDPLVQVMARLLGEGGCPWDRKQDHLSLRPYLIEECYEVIEAIAEKDMHKLREELGDLLLQIVFHAALAQGRGDFDCNDVVGEITEKMIRRHPHVFGQVQVQDSQEVLVNWQKIKDREKGGDRQESILGEIPRCFPALLRAKKLQGRAAQVGFDWDHLAGAWEKIEEELDELKKALDGPGQDAREEELGDLLFAIVNVARFLKIDPETALTGTNDKFSRRFVHIEDVAREQGRRLEDMTLTEMDALWDQAKIIGRSCNIGPE